jgi:predicted nucleic acid-binding protein
VLGLDEDVEVRAIRLRRAGLLKLPDAIVAATALTASARLLMLDQRMARVVAQEASSAVPGPSGDGTR